jgi:hypothetical protein
MEANGDRTIVSATYGGRPLVPVGTVVTGTTYMARAYLFYLNDAGLQAAVDNSFSVTWSGSPDNVGYAARIYGNVDQGSPIRGWQQGSSPSPTPNPIATSPLSVEAGDYVVAAAECGNPQTYTWNNGFAEGTDQTAASSDHSSADLAVGVSGSVVASAENVNPNRQVILGAVLVQAGATSGLVYYVRPDGNDGNDGDGPAAGQAWRTVSAAVQKAELGPGAAVYVSAGTYTGSVTPNIDGSSGSPIRFIADTTGSVAGWPSGSVVLAAPNGSTVLNLDNDDYLEFAGFTIRGTSSRQAVEVDDCDGVLLRNLVVYGGDEGIEVQDNSTLVIVNCVAGGNGSHGIETNDNGCTVEVWNSTLANNGGDGTRQLRGNLTVTNCILAFNGDDGLDRDAGSTNHTYNLSFGNGDNNFEGISAGATEIESDPLFADAAGGDYHLQSNSPAIDSGIDALGTVDDDLDGTARPMGLTWDMGCYEFALIGHWQFDEGAGIDAFDSSGNGHDGTLRGGADWVGARCAFAVELDGFGDWADLGAVSLGSSAYTAGICFKTSGGRRQTIFAATEAGTDNHLMLVQLESDGRIRYLHRFPAGTSGGTEIFSTDAFADDRWHYVTAVKTTATVTLHVDGRQVAQAADTSAVESPVDLIAGASSTSGGADDFHGSLDEIRVYGSGLSPAEVSMLYGRVGYWKFDEASGNTAADSTNLVNDGSLQGSPIWRDGGGTIEGALEFDGSGDYVEVANSSSLQMTDAVTIAAWVKSDRWDSGSYVNVIARKGEGNPNNYQLAVADGVVAFYLDDSDASGIRGNTPLNTGTWYHLAGTWDGSTVQIYVNGVLDNDPPDPRTGTIGTDSRALYIGGRSGTDLFDGLIDDLRIYNRNLCVDEIMELYSAGSTSGWRVRSWVEVDASGS